MFPAQLVRLPKTVSVKDILSKYRDHMKETEEEKFKYVSRSHWLCCVVAGGSMDLHVWNINISDMNLPRTGLVR